VASTSQAHASRSAKNAHTMPTLNLGTGFRAEDCRNSGSVEGCLRAWSYYIRWRVFQFAIAAESLEASEPQIGRVLRL
jgi:hypothetical protein